MSEKPPRSNGENEARRDPIDFDKRQTYRVLIQNDKLKVHFDEFVELPVYLAEDFIESASEKVLTTTQQVKREALTAYLNDYFSAGSTPLSRRFISQDITIEHPTVTDEK